MIRTRNLVAGILFLAGAGAVGPTGAAGFAISEVSVVTAKGRFAFTVEVAATEAERQQGLQNRRALASGAGMLFDFRSTRPVAMWMKNTLISLDIVFIAADGRIVNIARDTVPHSRATVPSAGAVRAVLELNAGTARRLGMRAGDRILHPIFGSGG